MAWDREKVIAKIQEAAQRVGREPTQTDMDSMTAVWRVFGSWEIAKQEAGVKDYAPEPDPEPEIIQTPYHGLSPDELRAEREASLARQAQTRAEVEARVRTRMGQIGPLERGYHVKLRDNEYLPPRYAVDVSRKRG